MMLAKIRYIKKEDTGIAVLVSFGDAEYESITRDGEDVGQMSSYTHFGNEAYKFDTGTSDEHIHEFVEQERMSYVNW